MRNNNKTNGQTFEGNLFIAGLGGVEAEELREFASVLGIFVTTEL
jgi:hypothetical protein